MEGIDTSYAQGIVDWAAVEQAKQFAFIRATEGISIVDSQFDRSASVLAQRTIPFGAYHLFRFPDSPQAQAEFFLSTAKEALRAGRLVPFIDCEDESAPSSDVADNIARLAVFADALERALSTKPMIYCSPYWWNEFMGGTDAFAGHPLVVADYTSGSPMIPTGWASATFWQYTSGGLVDGVPGYVDCDRLLVADLPRIGTP